MVWGEPKNKDDCYFCVTSTKGYNSSNLHTIKYANVSSIIKPIIVSTENSDEDHICFPQSEMDINVATEENEGTYSESDDESENEYIPSGKKNDRVKLFNQKELNDLIRELGLPKDGAELLASRLKERNLLTKKNTNFIL